jgi:DNA polymerase-3 subunit gamma/tau
MQEHYLVMARRWRPRRFGELVGQEAIVKTLENAIRLNKIAHAFLFIGPRGTGKTSTARLLAMALNAPEHPDINADPNAEPCRSIFEGHCMDVIEIDGASNNSVDQIRSLREECQYTPTACRFKIYIIDEVHKLSQSAFNALLKTLQEPPTHAKIYLRDDRSP